MIDRNIQKKIHWFLSEIDDSSDKPQSQKEITLLKFLQICKVAPRREIEETIQKKEVLVNGIPITELNYKIKTSDLVLYKGKRVSLNKNNLYLAINKPKGYFTKRSREKNIFQLLPETYSKKKLYLADELDQNSRGLVVLSTDVFFVKQIRDARYKVMKKYYVQLDNPIVSMDRNLLMGRGLKIQNQRYKFLSIVNRDPEKHIYEISLYTERGNLRKVFEELFYEVKDLYRFAIGELNIEQTKLPEGHYWEFEPSIIWKNTPEANYLFELYQRIFD
ncbi:MAG: pseudouridine synthase [Leptospiraceae bacterium]|nr:pseudouridine synthase [Leptospiraceae bacterium]MDW7976972.1 pseudouridine synthase [Leptospiraceae bacterium]